MKNENTRVHGRKIHQSTTRATLKARAEPYWASLGTGLAVGFRKNKTGPGTWVARWTEPEKDAGAVRPKYQQKNLGDDKMTYAEAVTAAQEFFTAAERGWKLQRRGVSKDDVKTVSDVLTLYVEKLRKGKATAEKGEQAAHAAETYFKKLVYDTNFGNTALDELDAFDVEQWRDGLVTKDRAKNTVNRIFRIVKAGLNYGFKRKLIPSDAPWRAVEAFPVKDGQRNVYLALDQRKALLDACDRAKTEEELTKDYDLEWATPDLGNLLRGLLYTGARPSELASAKVGDLDLRAKALTLTDYKGKTGEPDPRAFPLDDPAALAFFTKMAKDKLPSAYLMTKADGSCWVSEKGTARHQWGRGFRAAVRAANKKIKKPVERIPGNTTAYTLRHSAITDWLEVGESPLRVAEVCGTSLAMIEQHYFKFIRHGDKSKLASVQAF